jgi:putative ABC transport system permease protein
MIMQRYVHDFRIALESLISNKVKSLLTALGIIFGVAAVISMFAIGNGARKEILDQIKMVGLNNIVVESLVPDSENETKAENENQSNAEKNKPGFSKGLSLLDANAFAKLSTVALVSPQISIKTELIGEGKQISTSLEGVNNQYFEVFNLKISKGDFFNEIHMESGMPVCIIGSGLAKKIFGFREAVGKQLKCGNEWLWVIGVLESRNLGEGNNEVSKLSQTDDRVFTPVQTVLMRYRNRAFINSLVGKKNGQQNNDEEGNERINDKNYHQIDRVVIQVKEAQFLSSTSEILNRMLLRRHSGQTDFTITVPELLLKQQQRTKDIFNLVLGAIASISLIVGGIGIMNIMLASVLERIREIGTRRAIGATRRDIIIQFLAESVLISVSGGIIGIILGVGMARLITHFSGILTIVSPFSIIVAFGVSVSVGIIFGIVPARQAAEKDPVDAIRYE